MALTGLVAANNLGDVVDIEKTWDNIGNSISATVFVPSPVLDLNFASNKSLVDSISGQNLINYSRASTGTFVGSNGLIQTAASGVPRFDHNGATGESLGLLIEEARTNYILNSSVFTDSGFWQGNEGITISSNQITSPDGTLNGTLIKQDTSTSLHQLSKGTFGQQLIYTTSNYTISVFVKRFNTDRITLCESFHYGLSGYTKAGMVWDFSTESISRTFQWGNSSQANILGTSTAKLSDGWYRISLTIRPGSDGNSPHVFPALVIGDSGDPGGGGRTPFAGNGLDGVYIWGFQTEIGTGLTSYIPTASSAVTRAADYADITGTNFSRWYNNAQGTFYAEWTYPSSAKNNLTQLLAMVGYEGNKFIEPDGYTTTSPTPRNRKVALGLRNFYSYFPYTNGSYGGQTYGPDITPAGTNPSSLIIGGRYTSSNGSVYINSPIKRVSYHSILLTIRTLQEITTLGLVSSFPYSFSIKGRDILALKEVNKTSAKDFIFTKGLLSKAQPRLTTASQYTSSGVALRDAAMPKLAPVTRGNYFFSSGLTLSGATVQINGTNALSIATSPFSSSTATVPLLFAGLRPQTNWRISETMASGVVASPESAIPIATGDFLLFMKAGQS